VPEATTPSSSGPGTWSRWGWAVLSTSLRRPSPRASCILSRPDAIPLH